MNLALVSGAYPPELDGIGDYTHQLALGLSRHTTVSLPIEVFTRQESMLSSEPNIHVSSFYRPDQASSFRLLTESVDSWMRNDPIDPWIVLQYNPFSYGKRGFCPWVPKTLQRIRSKFPSLGLAVMFHETMVPKWPWKFALMHVWQSRILRSVCRSIDMAFVSTPRWSPQIAEASSRLPIHHLPVGSNIPLSSLSRNEARQRLSIPSDTLVLGVFGSAHVSKKLDWIAAAARTFHQSGRRIRVMHVGPEAASVKKILHGLPVENVGEVPANEVGMHLRSMDVLMAPFSDGVSTRRGSVMAALQHGVPVITNRSQWTEDIFWKDTPLGLMALDCHSVEAFAEQAQSSLNALLAQKSTAAELSVFYEKHFSWEVIADSLVSKLMTVSAR